MPVRAGEWEIDVLVRGESVPDSPFSVLVEQCEADAEHSYVILEGTDGEVHAVPEAEGCFKTGTRGVREVPSGACYDGGADEQANCMQGAI